jgi:hypothetical protein
VRSDLTLTPENTDLIMVPKELLVSQVVLQGGGTSPVDMIKLDIAAQFQWYRRRDAERGPDAVAARYSVPVAFSPEAPREKSLRPPVSLSIHFWPGLSGKLGGPSLFHFSKSPRSTIIRQF